MRKVLWEDFLDAPWQITEADCEGDDAGITGVTTLVLDTTCVEGNPIQFVFSLNWEAQQASSRVGDPEWDFKVIQAEPLAPVDGALLVGEDDATWAELFTDEWLFQDVILDGVWEAYTKADFIRECQQEVH